MGILNVTPDSFSDGAEYFDAGLALEHAVRMLEEGADIIDIGGESSRPGAGSVPLEEERRRILPVVSSLRKIRPDAIISVDTVKSGLADEALSAGADIINDISGLQNSPNMAEIAAAHHAGLILMHMRGTPENMQDDLHYNDLLGEISSFLESAMRKALQSGVKEDCIVLDPGIGFSKNTEQNLEILGNAVKFREIGRPLLVGPSLKSFIGDLLGGVTPPERKWGTAGAVAWLAACGVDIIRVHDVREIAQVLKIFESIRDKSRLSAG